MFKLGPHCTGTFPTGHVQLGPHCTVTPPGNGPTRSVQGPPTPRQTSLKYIIKHVRLAGGRLASYWNIFLLQIVSVLVEYKKKRLFKYKSINLPILLMHVYLTCFRGDIIILRSSSNPRAFICKRVTGLFGDRVENPPPHNPRTHVSVIPYLHRQTRTRIPIWVRISVPKMGTGAIGDLSPD